MIIKSKVDLRLYERGAYADIEYHVDDNATGQFLATVKVTVPLKDAESLSPAELRKQANQSAEHWMSVLLADTESRHQ